MFRRTSFVLALALSASGCRQPDAPDPRLVAQWIRASLAFASVEGVSAPVTGRISAYGSLAIYEGYAADPRSNLRSLAGQLNGLWSVPLVPAGHAIDGATAAAEAERVVLDSLFSAGSPATRRTIDSLAQAQIMSRQAAGVGREVSEWSVAHGRALGRVILAWAAGDGFLASRGRQWSNPQARGRWAHTAAADQRVMQQGAISADRARGGPDAKTTLPQFNPAQPTEPYWGALRTFALRNAAECAPPAPPAYSEARGSDFWKMGRELYDSVRALTPEKKELTQHWVTGAAETSIEGKSETRGFHWFSVIDQMVAQRQVTADEAAEAYALTAVAMADAYIGTWREKYRSLVVRPLTYVNRSIDPQWQALTATPPIPEYPSEHASLSAAAAAVLTTLLGDSIPFIDSTQAKPRVFQSLGHVRDEISASRVYAGADYVPAVTNGLGQGSCIGQRVLGRLKTRAGEGRP